jgi:hypothetical protein
MCQPHRAFGNNKVINIVLIKSCVDIWHLEPAFANVQSNGRVAQHSQASFVLDTGFEDLVRAGNAAMEAQDTEESAVLPASAS